MVDWGAGRYESTAAELEPVAADVVARARIRPGERLLDLACGTGNAALLAARAGAEVTGLDLAPRLIGVARERARLAQLDVDFHVGDAQSLPFDDEGFDVVLSVFGVIFAPDPGRVFAEITRVLRPGGRALITVWTPEGTIGELSRLLARAMAEATKAPPGERLAWHEPDAVAGLAAGHGAEARVLADGAVTFTADSAEEYLRRFEEDHPVSQAQLPVLERAGSYAAVRAQALAILESGNESGDAFAVTSRYRVFALS